MTGGLANSVVGGRDNDVNEYVELTAILLRCKCKRRLDSVYNRRKKKFRRSRLRLRCHRPNKKLVIASAILFSQRDLGLS